MNDFEKSLRQLKGLRETPAEQKARIAQEGLPEQPAPADMVQAEQINEEAKSPNLKTKEELVQDEQPDMLAELRNNIAAYKAKMEEVPEKDSGDSFMNALTGIGQAANVYNRVSGIPDKKVEYWGDKNLKGKQAEKAKKLAQIQKLQKMYSDYSAQQNKGQMTPYQKASLDLEKEKMEDKKEKAPSFLEKETIKADLKEKSAVQKENRSVRGEAEDSLKDIDKNIANVKKAVELMKTSTKSLVSDTGPIDQFISPLSTQGQKLRQVFNEISLDKMTKMFAGMSKAIDSDAERKFFEQSQVSMGSYPEVNMNILKRMLNNLENLKRKNQGVMKNISKRGERKELPQKVTVRTADGRLGTIPESKINAFLKKHPNAKIVE